MALPRVLQKFNVFLDGVSCIGEASSIKLPTLTRKTEEHQGITLDLGQEAITLEHTYAAILKEAIAGYGLAKVDGAQIRFAGAYDNPSTGSVEAIEIVVRGRHTELDMGDAEAGKKAEFKIKTACTYYKLSINDAVAIEIDLINHVFVVNGEDRYAAHRNAIGL